MTMPDPGRPRRAAGWSPVVMALCGGLCLIIGAVRWSVALGFVVAGCELIAVAYILAYWRARQ